jgi:hypothetical protein
MRARAAAKQRTPQDSELFCLGVLASDFAPDLIGDFEAVADNLPLLQIALVLSITFARLNVCPIKTCFRLSRIIARHFSIFQNRVRSGL